MAKIKQARSHLTQGLKRFTAVALLIGMGMLSVVALADETGVLTATVILRKSADQESKALQTLPKGDDVVLLGASGSWYKVNYGKYTGYVMKKYVKAGKSSVVANSTKIKSLGDAPGPMRIGDTGKDVIKLQKALTILNYYDGKADGDYGSGTTAAVANYQKDKGLEADGVAGRGTVISIFGDCAKSTSNASNSKKSSQSASTSTKSGGANTVRSLEEIGSIPEPSKEGDRGTKVKKLQQALHLLGYYSGDIDGDYGGQTVAAVKRFQKNRSMKEDGVAGSTTIRVLFGGTSAASKNSAKTSSSSSKKSYKTEILDWFKDDVSKKIPKNAKFSIKDIRTGKTFKAARWSGINHLDAEPASAEDTKILSSILGGAWSWLRRPILILYNGHVYAASMNGMPHGTTTISNRFGGHFCIHFVNSKTHGTGNVDPDHQSAIRSAGKATW